MKFTEELTEKIVKNLKERVDKEHFVDIGKGAETYYWISRERFRKAIKMLTSEDEKYKACFVKDHSTNITFAILTDQEENIFKEFVKNRDKWIKERYDLVAKADEIKAIK